MSIELAHKVYLKQIEDKKKKGTPRNYSAVTLYLLLYTLCIYELDLYCLVYVYAEHGFNPIKYKHFRTELSQWYASPTTNVRGCITTWHINFNIIEIVYSHVCKIVKKAETYIKQVDGMIISYRWMYHYYVTYGTYPLNSTYLIYEPAQRKIHGLESFKVNVYMPLKKFKQKLWSMKKRINV